MPRTGSRASTWISSAATRPICPCNLSWNWTTRVMTDRTGRRGMHSWMRQWRRPASHCSRSHPADVHDRGCAEQDRRPTESSAGSGSLIPTGARVHIGRWPGSCDAALPGLWCRDGPPQGLARGQCRTRFLGLPELPEMPWHAGHSAVARIVTPRHYVAVPCAFCAFCGHSPSHLRSSASLCGSPPPPLSSSVSRSPLHRVLESR